MDPNALILTNPQKQVQWEKVLLYHARSTLTADVRQYVDGTEIQRGGWNTEMSNTE